MQTTQPTTRVGVSRLGHIGIYARDLEKLRDFYRDVLGLGELVDVFHERGVRVFEPISLEENCSCSRERIDHVLRQMSAEEIREASAGGSIEVRCEFCGTHYRFDPADFSPAGA